MRTGAALLLATLALAPAAAQAPPADSARPRYLLPDIAPDALIYEGPMFWVKPVIGVIGDWGATLARNARQSTHSSRNFRS